MYPPTKQKCLYPNINNDKELTYGKKTTTSTETTSINEIP
ncbi:hypothetical protein LCGC14_2160730, partial [marine sediment metagenome]